jgi:putative oxidoreductase
LLKFIFSTKYSALYFDIAMLLLRFMVGTLMARHGFNKLTHFNETASHMNSLIGGKIEASLIIFAEFFCTIFIMLGWYTRLATIPLIGAMVIILLRIDHANIFTSTNEKITLCLSSYLVLILLGAGRFSVDAMRGK